jgi:hypothetical protein
VRMSPKLLGACAVLFFAPAIARAQAPTTRTAGDQIILPEKLVAEKPGTLAVLDDSGALAAGVSVDLSTGVRVTTDETGRARFVVTSGAGPFLASIPGTEVRASTVVVAAPESSSATIAIATCPRQVVRTEFFTVTGSNFRGDADENHVKLAGVPALILAASPETLEVWPAQSTPLGATNLQIANPMSDASVSVDVVALRIERRGANASPNSAAQTGKNQELVVLVDGTTAQTPLAVLNLSPGIVALTGGAFRRVMSSGGKENQTVLEIRTVHAGDASVSVQLAVRGGPAPDLNAARQALEHARVAASGDWGARVDGALERLNNEPGHASDVLIDIERMLEENPPRQIARYLETAWVELSA